MPASFEVLVRRLPQRDQELFGQAGKIAQQWLDEVVLGKDVGAVQNNSRKAEVKALVPHSPACIH